jgi:hypothetical protein
MNEQKRIELGYLEEARRASRLFPAGDPVPHENPDFLLVNRSLGIEVTELCHHEPRTEGARLDKILPKAKKRYDAHPNAKPIFVNVSLSARPEDIGHVDEMAAGLARFVIEHAEHYGNFSWDDGIPKGFCHIAVFEPEPDGHWFYGGGSKTELAGKELLDAYITKKNTRLSDYRKSAPEAWLLLVNDLCLGPGEVCFHLDKFASWTFDFDFDKVLFFERQPGGSGKVIELLRAERPQAVEALQSHA